MRVPSVDVESARGPRRELARLREECAACSSWRPRLSSSMSGLASTTGGPARGSRRRPGRGFDATSSTVHLEARQVHNGTRDSGLGQVAV